MNMKKTFKFILVVFMATMFLFGISQTISLADKPDVNNVVTGVENSNATVPGEVTNIGGTVMNWIWGISIVVAIVVLMITGLKFIVGSTQEKAKYKESLIPLVVGVLILVFATTIVRILFSM